MKALSDLTDELSILDLGCGWGSSAIYFALIFPSSDITALSNSSTQRAFIEARKASQGLPNQTVATADVTTYEFPARTKFDRVVSIEMLEHMENYEALLGKISAWLVARPEVGLFPC